MLGQFQPITPSFAGEWLIALMGILGLIWLARQIWVSFQPATPNPGAEFITRSEFASEIARIEASVKASINEIKLGIQAQLEKMDNYTHDSNHRLAQVMQALLLKVERLATLQEIATGKKLPEPVQSQPSLIT